MIDENPITLDDIIQMADAKDDLDLSLPVDLSAKPGLGAIKNISTVKKPSAKNVGSKKVASEIDLKPKAATEEILTAVKNVPDGVKIKEDNNQRIFERTCSNCNHIFFSDIPLRYFYVEGKKGENYKVIKLPAHQYPADLPQNILTIIESRECPKCRKK